MTLEFHIVQDSAYINVRWKYDAPYLTWGVTKMLKLGDPTVADSALVVSNTSPRMPATEGAARENARRWMLAADIVRMLDLVFVEARDFRDISLEVRADTQSTAHFNVTSGRPGGKRHVTIHVPR